MESEDFPSRRSLLLHQLKEEKILNRQEPNPEFLHLVTPDEFLPAIGRWTTLGGLVLLVAFGTAIALATVLKYKVTVRSPAIMRPTGELRIVQAVTEGTVKSIEIKANQPVKQGDVIAYIDDSRLQTKKSQLKGNIEQARKQLSQINAQLLAIDGRITAETNQMKRTLAAAAAEFRLNQRDYEDRLITTIAELEEAEAALELAQEELVRYQKLANTGAIAQLQIKEKEASVKTAIARVKKLRAYLNPSNARMEMAREKIAEQRAKGEATLARLKQEREGVIQRRIEIQNQISSDSQELQQIATELQNTIIRAPISGQIQELNLRNISQVVRPGEPIALISPSNAPLEIKALVASGDIAKVEIGQKVQMRVSACPYPDYGTLNGTVSFISPDATIPQNNSTSGFSSSLSTPTTSTTKSESAIYNVMIQPESLILIAGERDCKIQSGMEGSADIISQEETVLTFMLRKTRLLTDL
ncbi:MAG: HlyD family efflux transporter periplasmic adaptor subunit [Prochloraceae cyanobacterium]|nr:HlyD family efflux transporter periplasmic adaptor subunit [Prochloraceae cyanobacterium]